MSEHQGSVNKNSRRFSSTSAPFSTPIFYGWIVVFISALATYFSGPGQTYSISVFIDSYIRDLGLNRASVSGVYSIATLIAGLSLFVIGRLVDRYGARFLTVTVAVGLGLASIWSSFIVGPVSLFVSFLFLRLFGQGSLTLIPSTLVPQWFIRQRGRALSYMAIGGLASGASVPLINNWLINTWNWHVAWRVWSAMLILFFAPLAYYLIRNKPEDIHLHPDGNRHEQIEVADIPYKPGLSIPVHHVEESWTLREATRTPVFWLILFCAFVPSMVSTGITFNLFSILQEHSIDRNSAAFMLSLVPLIGFGCAFVSGFLLEKIQANYVISVAALFSLIELIVLYRARSTFDVLFFVLLWGLSQGFLNIAIKIIWPNYFGRKHLGSINSLNMMSTVVGSAFGPVPFGWAYDHFGGYQQILLAMMIFPFLAMVLALVSKKPTKHVVSN